MLTVPLFAQSMLLLAALQAAPAQGGAAPAVHATILLSSPQQAGEQPPVDVEMRSGANIRRLTVPLRSAVDVEVPAGVVYLRVVSDRFWSGSRAFDVRSSGQQLVVDVYPAGVIAGIVARPDGGRTVPAVNAIFADRESGGHWGKSVTVPCGAEGLRWSCVLPAGVHDVRLRVPGYISVYFLRKSIEAGRRVDVGETKLQRGSSIVGTVTVDGPSPAERPVITLEPVGLGVGMSGGDAMKQFRADAGVSDERGFFHLDGVAPGMYSVVASLKGYAPAKANAQVVEGRESELLAPLHIEKAKTLEISIEPPVDAAGNRWNVTLMAKRDESFYENVTQGPAAPDGRWGWRGARGAYEVQLRATDGKVWKEEFLTIDRDPTRVQVSMKLEPIHGLVRLGGHPLRAKLSFGGRNGPEAESLDDGAFSALLPVSPDGKWRVTVASEATGVQRDVKAKVSDDGEMIIDLPGGRLAGVVTDDEGNGVQDAIVSIENEARIDRFSTQVRSGAGGVFEAGGLDGGTYKLSAESARGQSDPTSIELDGEESGRIEIVLHPYRLINAVVSSASGPVGGAEIYIEPLQGTVTNRLYYSNATGEVKAIVPPGTESFDISVSAPGFARTFFRTTYQPDHTLQLRVGQTGGMITIDIPRSLRLPTTNWTYLARNGARVMLGVVQRWGVEQPSAASGDRAILDVPQVEPGAYSLCTTPAGGIPNAGPLDPNHCVSGVLAPFGHLTLRLE